jgi:hypothetical protein
MQRTIVPTREFVQMFRLISAVTLAAAFTFAVVKKAAADGEHGFDVALHDAVTTQASARAASLDDYTGVYETPDGALFVVVREGESLAVELPESIALPIVAAEGPSFVPDATVMRIAFETDADGQVHIVVSRSAEHVVVATRVPLRRGIVTIHDI